MTSLSDGLEKLEQIAELKAAVGYMRNAKIDLETGASKATAIRTISGGIARVEAALAKAETAALSAHEDWGDPDNPESVMHALDIASIGGPYSDIQGSLYGNPRYSATGGRDAEFKDYGLCRAVRILCNNAKRIKAALSTPSPQEPDNG